MGKLKYILLFIFFSGMCFAHTLDDSLKVQQVKNKIKTITSTDPNSEDTDLLFLLEAFKGKEIIAAGEATHGSKEFFTLKHRLFKLLCERSDVRIFGLEESYAAGLLVNDYINGRSNLKVADVVMKMSFMWRTKEMKDMIEWMKSYNNDVLHKDKITFFGFDFHGPHHAVKLLYKYFEQTDTAYLTQIKPFLKKFEEVTYPKEKIGDKEFIENANSISKIRNTLKSNRQKYVLLAGEEKWTETDHLLECLFQYTDTYKSGDVDFFKRDPYMCSNVKWIHNLNPGGNKIMLWAHNEHVASGGSLPSMGKLLKQEFGDKFYAIGFVFNEGEYTGTKQFKCSALEAGVFSFKPAPIGSFSNIVSLTGVKIGFLPMDGKGLDEKTANWFCGTQRVYEVGYRGFDNMKKLLLKKRKLAEIYNAVFFIEKVTNTEHYLFGPTKNGAVYFNPFPTN
jgi:erythromycin esterase